MKLITASRPIKSLFASIDWMLFFLIVAIIGIGIFNLTSIATILPKPLHNTQLLWVTLGFLFFTVPCASIDYRNYARFGHIIYAAGIGLLILVLIIGAEFNGSKRWISFGFFSMQPSELMKIAVVIFIAKYFSEREHRQHYNLKGLLPLFYCRWHSFSSSPIWVRQCSSP